MYSSSRFFKVNPSNVVASGSGSTIPRDIGSLVRSRLSDKQRARLDALRHDHAASLVSVPPLCIHARERTPAAAVAVLRTTVNAYCQPGPAAEKAPRGRKKPVKTIRSVFWTANDDRPAEILLVCEDAKHVRLATESNQVALRGIGIMPSTRFEVYKADSWREGKWGIPMKVKQGATLFVRLKGVEKMEDWKVWIDMMR